MTLEPKQQGLSLELGLGHGLLLGHTRSPFLASNLAKANLMRRTAPSRFVCAADVARQKFHEYLISDSIVDRLGQKGMFFRAIGNMILRQFRDIIKLHFVCFVCLCLLAKFIVRNLARKKPHSGCMNK